MTRPPTDEKADIAEDQSTCMPIVKDDDKTTTAINTKQDGQYECKIFQKLDYYWRQYIWPYCFEHKSAIWTAIFTGFLVLFSWLLWDVTDQTEKANEASQRAFVNYKEVSSTPMVDPVTKKIATWRFIVSIENSGGTPAKHALNHVSFAPRALPILPNYDFPDLGDATVRPFVMGPKQAITLSPVDISEDVLLGVQNQRMHLYFYGWVKYRDIFPGSADHLTEFCYELTDVKGDSSDPSAGVQIVFSSCAEHNCADEDCK